MRRSEGAHNGEKPPHKRDQQGGSSLLTVAKNRDFTGGTLLPQDEVQGRQQLEREREKVEELFARGQIEWIQKPARKKRNTGKKKSMGVSSRWKGKSCGKRQRPQGGVQNDDCRPKSIAGRGGREWKSHFLNQTVRKTKREGRSKRRRGGERWTENTTPKKGGPKNK